MENRMDSESSSRAKMQSQEGTPNFSPWPEVMCFKADTSSGLSYFVLRELKDAGRLQLKSVQKAYIIGMEGTKGRHSFGRDSNTSISAFSRTATHVFRMVMLEACGVDPTHWPSGGESSYRNEKKLKFEQLFGSKFVLADCYEEAREYWSEFDKMYPHYVIEKFLEEKSGTLNNVMIIFRNYMQEGKGSSIKCCIGCTLVHRSIDLQGANGQWLDTMSLVVRGTQGPLAKHFNMLLDLDTTKLTTAELDQALSCLYDSLPTSVSGIECTTDSVKAGAGSSKPFRRSLEVKCPVTQSQPHEVFECLKKEDNIRDKSCSLQPAATQTANIVKTDKIVQKGLGHDSKPAETQTIQESITAMADKTVQFEEQVPTTTDECEEFMKPPHALCWEELIIPNEPNSPYCEDTL